MPILEQVNDKIRYVTHIDGHVKQIISNVKVCKRVSDTIAIHKMLF